MDVVPYSPCSRGTELLMAHCASLAALGLDPRAPTVSERLADAVGTELAHKLVFALSTSSPGRARFAA